LGWAVFHFYGWNIAHSIPDNLLPVQHALPGFANDLLQGVKTMFTDKDKKIATPMLGTATYYGILRFV